MRNKEIKGEEGKTEGKVCDSILVPLIPPVLRMVLLLSLPASSTNIPSRHVRTVLLLLIGMKQEDGSENRDQLQLERQLEGQDRALASTRA